MDCNSLANISSGTTWPEDVTDLCLKTPNCTAVVIYYSTSYEQYMYCLNSASGEYAYTNATEDGPAGSSCLGIFYACEWR